MIISYDFVVFFFVVVVFCFFRFTRRAWQGAEIDNLDRKTNEFSVEPKEDACFGRKRTPRLRVQYDENSLLMFLSFHLW